MLLAAASGVALASDAGVTENRVTFQDARGEEPDGPDIAGVTVSNGDTGLIAFRIDVPSHAVLTEGMGIEVWLDSDNDASTGASGPAQTRGWDYRILWNSLVTGSEEARLLRCGATSCLSRPGALHGMRFSYANGARFTIGDAELGTTRRFRFSVTVTTGIVRDPATGLDWTKARWDFAPSLGGSWSYDVRLAPRLAARSFSTAPAVPLAGSDFTARLTATRTDTGAVLTSGRVACAAAIGGKAVRARSQGFVGKRATCVFAIPVDAAGKTLRGSITVRFKGKSVSRSFTRRIA